MCCEDETTAGKLLSSSGLNWTNMAESRTDDDEDELWSSPMIIARQDDDENDSAGCMIQTLPKETSTLPKETSTLEKKTSTIQKETLNTKGLWSSLLFFAFIMTILGGSMSSFRDTRRRRLAAVLPSTNQSARWWWLQPPKPSDGWTPSRRYEPVSYASTLRFGSQAAKQKPEIFQLLNIQDIDPGLALSTSCTPTALSDEDGPIGAGLVAQLSGGVGLRRLLSEPCRSPIFRITERILSSPDKSERNFFAKALLSQQSSRRSLEDMSQSQTKSPSQTTQPPVSPDQPFTSPSQSSILASNPRALNLPAVFISGAIHGDERLGPAIATEFAKWLVDQASAQTQADNSLSYGGLYAKWLVRNRDIWILPFANAYGFVNNQRTDEGIDPNRDFPYNNNECFKSFTSRYIDSVFHSRLFQLGITFHGGMRALTYPWGSYNHAIKSDIRREFDSRMYISTESPDEMAMSILSRRLQQASGVYLNTRDPQVTEFLTGLTNGTDDLLTKILRSERHVDYKILDSLRAVDAQQIPTIEEMKMLTQDWLSSYNITNDINESLIDSLIDKFKWYYPIGPISNLIYPLNGAMEDWAYGGGWEEAPIPIGSCPRSLKSFMDTKKSSNNQNNMVADPHLQLLLFLLETDDAKSPDSWSYGETADLDKRSILGGFMSGSVSRNIKICTLLTEMARPDLLVTPMSPSKRSDDEDGSKFGWSSSTVIDTLRRALTYSLTDGTEVLPLLATSPSPIIEFDLFAIGCVNVSSAFVIIHDVSLSDNVVADAIDNTDDLVEGIQFSGILVLKKILNLKCSSIAPWSVPQEVNPNKVIFKIPEETFNHSDKIKQVRIVIELDSDFSIQDQPDPKNPPMSHFVNARRSPKYLVHGLKGDRIEGTRKHIFPRARESAAAGGDIKKMTTGPLLISRGSDQLTTPERLTRTYSTTLLIYVPPSKSVPIDGTAGHLQIVCTEIIQQQHSEQEEIDHDNNTTMSTHDRNTIRCKAKCDSSCKHVRVSPSTVFQVRVLDTIWETPSPSELINSDSRQRASSVSPTVLSFVPEVLEETEFILNWNVSSLSLSGKIAVVEIADKKTTVGKRRRVSSEPFADEKMPSLPYDGASPSTTNSTTLLPMMCLIPARASVAKRYTPSHTRLARSLQRDYQSMPLGDKVPISLTSSSGYIVAVPRRHRSPLMSDSKITINDPTNLNNNDQIEWVLTGKFCMPHIPKDASLVIQSSSKCVEPLYAGRRTPSFIDPFAARVVALQETRETFECTPGSRMIIRSTDMKPEVVSHVSCTWTPMMETRRLQTLSNETLEESDDVHLIRSFLNAAVCPKATVLPPADEARFTVGQKIFVASFGLILGLLVLAQFFLRRRKHYHRNGTMSPSPRRCDGDIVKESLITTTTFDESSNCSVWSKRIDETPSAQTASEQLTKRFSSRVQQRCSETNTESGVVSPMIPMPSPSPIMATSSRSLVHFPQFETATAAASDHK